MCQSTCPLQSSAAVVHSCTARRPRFAPARGRGARFMEQSSKVNIRKVPASTVLCRHCRCHGQYSAIGSYHNCARRFQEIFSTPAWPGPGNALLGAWHGSRGPYLCPRRVSFASVRRSCVLACLLAYLLACSLACSPVFATIANYHILPKTLRSVSADHPIAEGQALKGRHARASTEGQALCSETLQVSIAATMLAALCLLPSSLPVSVQLTVLVLKAAATYRHRRCWARSTDTSCRFSSVWACCATWTGQTWRLLHLSSALTSISRKPSTASAQVRLYFPLQSP